MLIRLVGLRVSVSHDLAAVPDACAHVENTCPGELYMYESRPISWLFIRIHLNQKQSHSFVPPTHACI